MAPATPTLQAALRNKPLTQGELVVLLAYLEQAQSAQPADRTHLLTFFLLGFSGMVLALAALHAVWRQRLCAVRQPPIATQQRGEM